MRLSWKCPALFCATILAFSLSFAPVEGAAAERYRIYVSNEEAGTVSVIDSETMAVARTIPVGRRPRGIRASPDGKRVYVALSGSPIAGPNADGKLLPAPDKDQDGIGVIDVTESKLLHVLRGVSDPEQAAVSPDGRTLFVASEDTGKAAVIDAQDGAILANVDVGGEPEGVRVSPDGRLVIVTSEADSAVTLIEVASYKTLAKIHVGERPRDVVFSPDSKFAYISGEADASITIIDIVARTVRAKVTLEGEGVRPMGLALSSDANQLVVSGGRGRAVFSLDAKTLSVIRTARVGERPWGVALSPDDGTLFTANGLSNDVSVLNANTLKIFKTIPVGLRPWGVAVVPVQ